MFDLIVCVLTVWSDVTIENFMYIIYVLRSAGFFSHVIFFFFFLLKQQHNLRGQSKDSVDGSHIFLKTH